MPDHVLLSAAALPTLVEALHRRGYRVLGPTRTQGAIALGDLADGSELPRGVGDEQDAGNYRLRERDDELLFGFATTAQSPKSVLFPPDELLWRGVSDGARFTVARNPAVGGRAGGHDPGRVPAGPGDPETASPTPEDLGSGDSDSYAGADPYGANPNPEGPDSGADRRDVDRDPNPPPPDDRPVAILGVRGCDLAAIAIQDRILLGRTSIDAHYALRRGDAFLVAVTCGTPGGTCFCASMGTGPAPGPGADLTVTELADPHRFLVAAGTPLGVEVLAELPTTPAGEPDLAAAEAVVASAVAAMGRRLRTDDLHDLLFASAESPRWNDVATRCLACTNCTAVCPTCFCTTIADVTDLAGRDGERHRVWDSCFSMEYSTLHGGAVRSSIASRYRQWLTHKLASWTDQFGMIGCVGCGRCITWCPAGIDLTVEVAALRELSEAHGAVAAGVGVGAVGAGGAATPRAGAGGAAAGVAGAGGEAVAQVGANAGAGGAPAATPRAGAGGAAAQVAAQVGASGAAAQLSASARTGSDSQER